MTWNYLQKDKSRFLRKLRTFLAFLSNVGRDKSQAFPYVPPGIKTNHFSRENPLDEECAQSWCRAKVQPWIAIRTHLFQARLWLWTFTKVFGSKVIYYWFVTRLDVQTIFVNSYVSSIFYWYGIFLIYQCTEKVIQIRFDTIYKKSNI